MGSRGGFSRMQWKEVSECECVYSSDFFTTEDVEDEMPEDAFLAPGESRPIPGQVSLKIKDSGPAHALMGRWRVVAFPVDGSQPNMAHDLYTASYVQMLNVNEDADSDLANNPAPI